MKCNAAVAAVGLLFATSAIIRGVDIGLKESTIVSKIITTILSIDTILIPAVVIGGCKMMDMACHTKAFPFIYLVSTILIIIDVIQMVMLRKNNN